MVMAKIYTIVGEHDLAIQELAYSLSIEGWSTEASVSADPIYAPLRANPRFQALLEKYEKEP